MSTDDEAREDAKDQARGRWAEGAAAHEQRARELRAQLAADPDNDEARVWESQIAYHEKHGADLRQFPEDKQE